MLLFYCQWKCSLHLLFVNANATGDNLSFYQANFSFNLNKKEKTEYDIKGLALQENVRTLRGVYCEASKAGGSKTFPGMQSML